MSFICLDCGEIFDLPSYAKERHTELDTCDTEIWETCPNCTSGDFVEAVECAVCGDMISCEIRPPLCHKCAIQAHEKFMDHIATYSDEELEYIQSIYEGEPWR